MKKQFFYAALAIGMMSSCTSSDLPGNQAPEEQLPEEERVAIELGIQAPGSSITASTKSTGAVGGMDDETNLWNGQKLYVVAYNKGLDTKVIDTETGDYIFEGLEFKAPTQTWDAVSSSVNGGDKIYILKDQSTVQAVYYNPTGNMDFYGYHIDEAGDGRTTGVLNGFTVENLTIDGAQDLLGARTKEVNAINYPSPVDLDDITAFNAVSPERGFSAWAARRGIQPILDFKHLLTRFTFTVEAAEKTAAEWFWDGSTWIQNVSTESEPASTAVKIKKIIIKDVSTNVDIVLFDEQAAPYVKVREASSTEDLELQGRASGSSVPLTATAAKVFDNSEQSEQETHKTSWSESNGSYSLQTPVGESLMIPAGNDQITLHIELEQHVVDTEQLDGTPITYKDKTGTVEKTLNFTDVTGGAGGSVFAAGASYAVNIKVFSFQRIEITAALSKWADGGNLKVHAE